MKGGRHIQYAEPTPLANLHLTLLDSAGVVSMRSPTATARSTNLPSPRLVKQLMRILLALLPAVSLFATGLDPAPGGCGEERG